MRIPGSAKTWLSVAALVMTAFSPSTAEAGETPTTTGRLRVTFTEHGPLSDDKTVLQRLGTGENPPDNLAGMAYDLSFDVFVPPAYNPNIHHGIFVWMGVPEFPVAWQDILARHRLILACANNKPGLTARHGAALDAVHNLVKRYSIDKDRVYVSGFSAGGQLATHMVRCFPEVFRGGLFLLGGNFYLSRQTERGQREPTVEAAHPLWMGQIDQLKQNTKLVMIKGGNDPQWPAQEGRSDYKALWLDGFVHVTYFEVPGLGHVLPNANWFEMGVAALDESKPLTPPDVSPTTNPKPLPGQVAQAQRILATARYYLDQKPHLKTKGIEDRARQSSHDKARKYLRQLTNEYPTTSAADKARSLLITLEPATE